MSERAELDGEILAWMREEANATSWEATPERDARFADLALRLFAFQFERCTPYARFCEARGATPASVSSWRDVPSVPAGVFKEVALRTFAESDVVKTFRTSGTATARRGELHLDTMELYEASLLPTIARYLFPELRAGERMTVRVLAPSPEEAPDSSLSHMFGCAVDALGATGSGFDLVDGKLQTEHLLHTLEAAREPVALCGTAFALVHLLESQGGTRLVLPEGSRVMETGGFKGRSREMSRDVLYADVASHLGVSENHIVNQYGMTELGSQFYDSVLVRPGETRRKLGPPWARVRIIDPETGREASPGEVGVIAIHDLANTGSIAAITTADLGRTLEDGFEILGREPEAEARGCSIAIDVMLGA